MELQINHGEYKKGRMSFLDTYNLSEFAPLTNAIIEISYTDGASRTYSELFILVEVDTIRLKDNRANIVVRFEEVTLNALKLTYISKAFSNKTMIEMLGEVFTSYNINGNFISGENDFVYEHFVFPSNISLYEFIEKQKKYSGITIVSDKGGLNYFSRDLTNFTNVIPYDGTPYTINYETDNPFWNILEYNAITSPRYVIKAAEANTDRADASNIVYNPDVINIDNAWNTEVINGFMGIKDKTLPEMIQTYGRKEIDCLFHNEIQGLDEDYRDLINSNHQATLVLQGQNVNRLYTKVKISIPRPASVDTPQADEVFSIEGVVTEVIDKIIGGIYSQFLTINTSDFGKAHKDTWGK